MISPRFGCIGFATVLFESLEKIVEQSAQAKKHAREKYPFGHSSDPDRGMSARTIGLRGNDISRQAIAQVAPGNPN